MLADEDFVANFDRPHYWEGPATDKEGRCRFEVLVPGATYRLAGGKDGNLVVGAEFSVTSGDTLTLPDVMIDLPPTGPDVQAMR